MFSVEVVIPVYNEEHVLAGTVERLREYLRAQSGFTWRILTADNASTDGTLEVARQLKDRYPGEVDYLHIPQKGRGRALKAAWLQSDRDVVCYMDVDLSTDIGHIPALVGAVGELGYDMAIGSRLARGAIVQRSLKREVISRGYVGLIKLAFLSGFSDAQCGFKAISRSAAHELLPLVENNEWFFDTELLLLAERFGYRIFEIPVRWDEDLDTRVNIRKTVIEDLNGLWRVRRIRVPNPRPPREA
jgi:glycosyltransferase involved in cell wall biosynthesis